MEATKEKHAAEYLRFLRGLSEAEQEAELARQDALAEAMEAAAQAEADAQNDAWMRANGVLAASPPIDAYASRRGTGPAPALPGPDDDADPGKGARRRGRPVGGPGLRGSPRRRSSGGPMLTPGAAR